MADLRFKSSEVHSKPSQTIKIKLFRKIVNGRARHCLLYFIFTTLPKQLTAEHEIVFFVFHIITLVLLLPKQSKHNFYIIVSCQALILPLNHCFNQKLLLQRIWEEGGGGRRGRGKRGRGASHQCVHFFNVFLFFLQT